MKINISRKNPREHLNQKKVLNFINLNTVWHLKNNPNYKNLMSENQNIHFPDGKILSVISKISQKRGPTFTKEFLLSKEAKSKKHFFIGLKNKMLKDLSKITNISEKNLFSYNPPYINSLEFSEDEKNKITKLLKKTNPHYVWVCVGSPKQEILANQLFKKYPLNYFNVGAALDFLLSKKKEAPKIFRKLGLEWAYRLITDFKYSKKKVWRSFVGLKHLLTGRAERE